MKSFFLVAAAAGLAAAAPQAFATPTAVISASGAPPPSCTGTYNGEFQLQVVNATAPSKKLARRQMTSDGGALIVTLTKTILTSTRNATAEVASNGQFQFSTPDNDGQSQPGFLYNAGFTACPNSTIAHGSTTIFYQCNGGDRNIIADSDIYPGQCYPVFLEIIPYGTSSPASSTATVTSSGASVTAPVTTATPATQSPDGQPAGGSSGVVKTSSVAVVSQISDNQPQIGTPSAVKTTSPVALITQISDNQPQAPTAVATALLTVISDNQPQAPTPAQTPYRNATYTTGPVQFTGAANSLNGGSVVALAAGAVALALL